MRALLVLCAVVALAGGACDAVGDVVTTGPIAQKVAEDTARFSSGVSLASVEVVLSRLSTYGAERPGGRLAPPDRQVWAVILSGAFPYGSCTINILGSPAPRGTPCPAPAPRQRVLVDARSGQVIESILGG
jgi:hypothetical protein